MSNPNPTSPLFEHETKDLCDELSRRSPGGIYICMFQPPVTSKKDEVTAGFYYKAGNIDGIAKIIGHTLMWFLGSRVTMPGHDPKAPESEEEGT